MRRRWGYGPQDQLRRAHRGSETDLTNKEPACVRVRSSAYMLWLCVAWCSCGTPNKKGSGGSLWHFCLLLGPVSMSSCDRRVCAQSYCILLYVGHAWWISLGGLLLFPKGNWGGVDLGERGSERRNWEEWKEGKLQSRCKAWEKTRSYKNINSPHLTSNRVFISTDFNTSQYSKGSWITYRKGKCSEG